MTESMVERVAKAMAAAEGWRWEDNFQMLDCAAAGTMNTSRERVTWRNRARAALMELRKPTQAMLVAGARGSGEDSEGVAIGCWESMIDAALEEGKQ